MFRFDFGDVGARFVSMLMDELAAKGFLEAPRIKKADPPPVRPSSFP